MSDQDKIHAILLEKIASLENMLAGYKSDTNIQSGQIAKAHLAITQHFGGGVDTEEGSMLPIRIKAISGRLTQANKDIKHYADAYETAQTENLKLQEKLAAADSVAARVDKLWAENTKMAYDTETQASLAEQIKSHKGSVESLVGSGRMPVEQELSHLRKEVTGLRVCVDRHKKEISDTHAVLDGGASIPSVEQERLCVRVGLIQSENERYRRLNKALSDKADLLKKEVEDARNFLSVGWGIHKDGTSLCKRINHLARGYILKIDELERKLSLERTATDGALRATQNVNEILDNEGVTKCGVLTVRIGNLLENHRQEVEELKRTQLARREKAKAHKDGELGRAQDTLRYCQDKLQGIYPDHRLSLRELVDSAVLAIRYAGPRSIVSQENELRARIEHLEKNEKEQADAYARQWDSVRSTVEELKVKAPCWPDIILELADRLRSQPKSADPMDASMECMKKFFDSHPHISSVKATYRSSGLYEFLWDNGTEMLRGARNSLPRPSALAS